MSSITPSRILCKPLNGETKFEAAFSYVFSETIKLVCFANTPAQYSGSASSGGFLLLPLQGETVTRYDRRRLEWGGRSSALYLPSQQFVAEAGARLAVGVAIDQSKLEDIAHIMAGPAADKERLLDFNAPRRLNLNIQDVRFYEIFSQHFSMIDAMQSDPAKIDRSIVADMLLRMVTMIFAPDLFFAEEPKTDARSRSTLSLACEYIEGHLDNRVTLTELEKITGKSARSLQFLFRKETGMSPVQWITARRLEKVHDLIAASRPGQTLTAIASVYFSNLGDFARLYRMRYGEPPSQALARAHSRALRT